MSDAGSPAPSASPPSPDTSHADGALPRPMLLSQVYTRRVEVGMYDDVVQKIVNMKLAGLANVDYIDHFIRKPENYGSNLKFVGNDGADFLFNVFGEIQNPSQGTCVRAQGNHFHREGEKFQPIDDSSKIKDTLALGVPTHAPIEMDNLFRNQTVPLVNVYAAIAAEDDEQGNDPYVKKCTKARDGGKGEHDIIVITMLPKFNVPAAAGAPKVAKRQVKRKLDAVNGSAPPEPDPVAKVYPSDKEIYIGAHYDPHLLPDYGGDYFKQDKARLIQLDVTYSDEAETIIPPWENYDVLKPGTLVIALCTLHCFVMSAGEPRPGRAPKQRRVFQLNAHQIKVVDVSDEIVQPRVAPVVPASVDRVTAGLPARIQTAASTSFSQLTFRGSKSPSKSPAKSTPSAPASSSKGASSIPSAPTSSSKGPSSAAASSSKGASSSKAASVAGDEEPMDVDDSVRVDRGEGDAREDQEEVVPKVADKRPAKKRATRT
ncbi:hypothetical protein C8R43DRAFT_1125649 [Mycena crocata]|nr:hypothetical protein C8R43DRAFT_1125649 [Mycena crocata]